MGMAVSAHAHKNGSKHSQIGINSSYALKWERRH